MSKMTELQSGGFKAEVLESELPILVDFWASWCGPCKALTPTMGSLAEEYDGRVKVVKIDIDKFPELLAQFNFRSVPTVILFEKGEAVFSANGAKSKEFYRRVLDGRLQDDCSPSLTLAQNLDDDEVRKEFLQRGELDVVREVLKKDPSVARRPFKMTPDGGFEAEVFWLLAIAQEPVSPERLDLIAESLDYLDAAKLAVLGRKSELKALLESDPSQANVRDSFIPGVSTIELAIGAKQLDCARVLADAGARISDENDEVLEAIVLAALRTRDLRFVSWLVDDFNLDFKGRTLGGSPAAHFVAVNNMGVDILAYLLEHGAALLDRNDKGETFNEFVANYPALVKSESHRAMAVESMKPYLEFATRVSVDGASL